MCQVLPPQDCARALAQLPQHRLLHGMLPFVLRAIGGDGFQKLFHTRPTPMIVPPPMTTGPS